jgi:hypothetical protein
VRQCKTRSVKRQALTLKNGSVNCATCLHLLDASNTWPVFPQLFREHTRNTLRPNLTNNNREERLSDFYRFKVEESSRSLQFRSPPDLSGKNVRTTEISTTISLTFGTESVDTLRKSADTFLAGKDLKSPAVHVPSTVVGWDSSPTRLL